MLQSTLLGAGVQGCGAFGLRGLELSGENEGFGALGIWSLRVYGIGALGLRGWER